MKSVVRLGVSAATLLLCAVTARAQPSVTVGSDPTRILLKGVVVRPSGPITGEVLISGGDIKCAAASCPSLTATVIKTDGIIFPGLIDAHNHAGFNMLDEADWMPEKVYRNHNQWPRTDKGYKRVMAAKKHLEGPAGLACEMDKYGEIKALIAGTTSVLLAPKMSARACFASLARTIDTQFNDLTDDLSGEDRIKVSISVPGSNADARKTCNSIDSAAIDTFVVHIGEGIDETSRKEFDTLAKRATGCLLRSQTTIVHGTAFGRPEFEKMAEKAMALVWSPKSNLFLYKRDDGRPATTDIGLAIEVGVKRIALGPDWGLGGSVNLLDELRAAEDVAKVQGWTAVSRERLFRMVTIDAAKALGLGSELGSIEVGKKADLMVVSRTGDPFKALLESAPKDVRLVMVNGRVLFGDKSLAAAAAFPPCEQISICGAQKFLCVAEPTGTSADKRTQTLAQIRDALEEALRAYDTSQPAGSQPFMPLAPLFSPCSP